MDIKNLGYAEKDEALRFMLDRLRPKERGDLIVQHPVVYRKMLGLEITQGFREEIKAAVLAGCDVTESEQLKPAEAKPPAQQVLVGTLPQLTRFVQIVEAGGGIDPSGNLVMNATTVNQLSALYVDICAAQNMPVLQAEPIPTGYGGA